MTTRASSKPLKRLVLSVDASQEFVAEITDRVLTLRPPKTRRGGPQEIQIGWGSIYLRAMMTRVEEQRKLKRRKRR